MAGFVAFVGGLGSALLPCVYPMVAITVSVFGASRTDSRGRGVALSATFVLGLVVMFVGLGLAAALTGKAFGTILQNQWIVVGIAVLFLAMAASMFGAFELTLPSGITNRLHQVGGIGFKGAFTLGLVCGLIATPCTGPILTGILALIARTQDVALGAGAMGAYALGLGVPFFLVGALAVQLPRGGRWMVHVKSAFGVVMVIVALYFLSTVFPMLSSLARPGWGFLGAAMGVAVLGVLLGAIHRDFSTPDLRERLMKGAGVVLTSVAGFAFVSGLLTPDNTLSWEKATLAAARDKARRETRPLLVDFTAAWCVACKEMDKITFAAPEVAREAGRFVAVKVDATDDEDPGVQANMSELSVVGLPTVVVLDSSGQEAVRCTDFVEPGPFLDAISAVN